MDDILVSVLGRNMEGQGTVLVTAQQQPEPSSLETYSPQGKSLKKFIYSRPCYS
jgi:hypothetical protein